MRIFYLVIVASLLLVCASCTNSSNEMNTDKGIVKPEQVSRAMSATSIGADYRLVVNDMLLAGKVDISDKDGYLFVDIELENGWEMSGFRFYAGEEEPPTGIEYQTKPDVLVSKPEPTEITVIPSSPVIDEVPQNLDPVNNYSILTLPLPYETNNLPNDRTFSFVFSLRQFESDTITIQAEADVRQSLTQMTANVRHKDRMGNTFTYLIDVDSIPEKSIHLTLPEDPMSVYFQHGTEQDASYYNQLPNCPEDCDIGFGWYKGWCVDLHSQLSVNTHHDVQFYNPLSPDLPEHLMDDDWDMINYILNHKQGDRNDVQSAIWYFVGGGGYPNLSVARAIIEDAKENGEGYLPSAGEMHAVILYIAPGTQTTIIENETDSDDIYY